MAAVATQKVETVDDVSRTAPRARTHPSGAPSALPASASASASPRKSDRMVRRDTPTVRNIPISGRRVMTDTDTVL